MRLASLPSRTVPLETNLARKAIWALGSGSATGISCLDAAGPTKANRRLTLLDLDVLTWLCAQVPAGSDEVSFSKYLLGRDLFGHDPSGRERQLVEASLARLTEIRLAIGGYDPETREMHTEDAFASGAILREVWPSRRHGASAGPGVRWTAVLDPWIQRQLRHGFVTYLDWATLRSLKGLQKRLWIYLEAERFRRQPRNRRLDRSVEWTWFPLSRRTLASLGVFNPSLANGRSRVKMAAERLHSHRADLHYKSIQIKRDKGQWILSASRRAYIRGEPWRHAGIQPDWNPRALLAGSEEPRQRSWLWFPTAETSFSRASAYRLDVDPDDRELPPPYYYDDHGEKRARKLVELVPLSWQEYRALLQDRPEYVVTRVETRVDPLVTPVHRASCSVLKRQRESHLEWARNVAVVAPEEHHLDYWVGFYMQAESSHQKELPRCRLCFPRPSHDDFEVPF